MIILVLFFAAFTAVAYTLGRQHEKHLAEVRRDREVEEERITRPLVTVTDGGWSDLTPADVLAVKREVLLDDEPRGRHDHRVAIGTCAQRARIHQYTHEFHALVGGTWSAEERAELEGAVT